MPKTRSLLARTLTVSLFAALGALALPALPAAADAHSDFIEAAGIAAQASRAEYGVPASVTVGQAILESSWGTSTAAVQDKNYFGIKCGSGGPGPIATGCVTRPTTECTPAPCHTVNASFRVYASMRDSFRDHGLFLRAPRYAAAFNYMDNPNQFVEEIRKAGYATDPQYTSKVVNLMTANNLYRFDTPARRVASLSGDGGAEITATLADGSVKAWYNARGFAEMPWGASAIVATGMDPARTFFADLDGDGRKEIINIQPNGDAKAWYNARGFAEMPWGASAIVGTGIDPARTYFADLDGDGRAEIMTVLADGSVKAWHNDRGFAEMPWGPSTIIATGMDPARTKFADLDGDGRAEITTTLADGSVKAWYNARGFAEMPWGASAIVATGMDPAKTFFADFDGDGRAEIANVQANGDLKAWYNVGGFAEMPWGASTIVGTGIDPARTILA